MFALSMLRFAVSPPSPFAGIEGDLFLRPDKIMLPGIMQSGNWQLEEVEFVERHLLQNPTTVVVIDVGANQGLFSRQIFRSREVAQRIARIYCVEPDPANMEVCRLNLQFARIQVQFFEIAVGDQNGFCDFYLDKTNVGNYSLVKGSQGQSQGFIKKSVLTIEAGTFFAGLDLPNQARIVYKSDTQGFDYKIFSMMPESLLDRIECAILELWRLPDRDRSRDEAFLQKLRVFRRLSFRGKEITHEEIAAYIQGADYEHTDLFVSR